MTKQKVVLAYSGGLDTTVCIRYLQLMHNLDVITLTIDCGQNEDFKEIEKKALSVGCQKHIFIDSKEEFASEFIQSKPTVCTKINIRLALLWLGP